jgi:cytochrome c
MKKYVVFAALCTAMVACNSSDGTKKAEEKPSESTNATAGGASTAANDKALEMIGSLDCTTCHKISEKNIGPAYTEVAQKYEATEANINMLADKVIKGGSGNWGTVPMTPHPSLSADSAKEMVKYILSLKNQ